MKDSILLYAVPNVIGNSKCQFEEVINGQKKI